MKLYTFSVAPNPRRVHVYLAEKGIDVAMEVVDIVKGENKSEAYLARSPRGLVPLLELDDGTCYGESLAIMEYFEELHPEPPMIGETPEERLRVRGIERLCELNVVVPITRYMRHSHPLFVSRLDQKADIAASGKADASYGLGHVDRIIGDNEFVAGDRPTIADCTLFAGLAFVKLMQLEFDFSEHLNVSRWWTAFSQRPSTKV